MDSNTILAKVSSAFPYREKQILKLHQILGHINEPVPESLFIYGHTSTGKSSIINSLLSHMKFKYIIVNLIETFNNRILFETIINKCMNHSLSENGYKSYTKCDNLTDFIAELKLIYENNCLDHFVIVLDKIERIRGNEALLSVFLRLQEITNLNICVIMLSDIVFEQFFPISLKRPIKIFFPNYTKDELFTILSLDFKNELNYVEREYKQSLDVNEDFYKNYVNIVLSVFYRVCRDLSEIRHVAHLNFKEYCHPIITNKINLNDVSSLWRNISPNLKNSLEILYLRFNFKNIDSDSSVSNKSIILALELPFYAKYLLIAAYLASYNPIKEDKRLFMKIGGKKRNTKRRIDAKQYRVSEKTNLELGPKLFALDRLLAIFYAIIDEQVPLTSNLLVQLSSLVELKLLHVVGNDTDLSSRKYRCFVDFEFIQTVSKMVGFNIRKYLFDLQ